MLLAALATLVASQPALAAFPGENGKIAFFRNYDIWTMNPDASGQANLTNNPTVQGFHPAWSADGTKIAFAGFESEPPTYWDVFVMNPDGSGVVNLTNTPTTVNDRNPAWSPDGTKIAYLRDDAGVMVMNADGSDQTPLTATGNGEPNWSPDGTKIAFGRPAISVINSDGTGEVSLTDGSTGQDREPNWSPDGTKIVFTRAHEGTLDVFVMNADGTGQTNLTADSSGHSPVWSPDGTKIAFSSARTGALQIWTMNPDGSGATQVTTTSSGFPDWQPVQSGYPRPKGASPLRASLVPAYIACFSPNRTHGPPLAFDSCSPPAERSGVLTVGTPDANGAAAGMVGSVKFEVQAGNPATPADEADVAVGISITDVRCRATSAACPGGPLSDYEGRLLAVPNAVRMTDRANTPPGPSGGPGTGDAGLQLPFGCTATADPATGSTCTLATTIDALLPGAVAEGRRAIWELGQLQVRDSGPNGTGFESPACPPDCGDGDETLFLRQGLFVP